MGLFKSKGDKEIEKKMLIRRTINSMNKQIAKLEEQKKMLVDKAVQAKKSGLDAQYELALTGYKMTLLQQKRAQEMLLNFEITSQMKDMTMMTREFLGGMSVLSKEMAKLADEKEFYEVQKQFETAMGKAELQAEHRELFLALCSASFQTAAGNTGAIDDAELREMIERDAGKDAFSDDAIDKELQELRKKLDSEV